jgi:hypothetical protein
VLCEGELDVRQLDLQKEEGKVLEQNEIKS